MIDTFESSIRQVSPPWFMPTYETSKRRLTWPNGMVAIAYSGDEPDQLRGPQHGSAWVDELAKFKYPRETWDNLMFGLRVGNKPQVCVTTTPRPIPLIQELIADPLTVDVVGSSFDNRGNLSPVFFDTVLKPYIGTRLGKQEIEGALLNDVPGALWKLATIEAHRVRAAPELKRIVVGVDPPAGSKRDECGIVVAGIAQNGDGYVLEDGSLQGTPAEWGKRVIDLYAQFKADCIVAEVNQGGDMVEHTILTMRGIEGLVNVRQVRATRGKYTRAEPISAKYERGLVHHVGAFADLESQMCNWVPGAADSPDRMDALVWALTDLNIGHSGGGWG
jgi:phage terminase large subunit-like protein